MKRIFIAALAGIFMCPQVIYAQTKQKLNINEATVFLSGAELLSTASLTLAKGENEILFTNVAGNVNAQSLSISTTNEVVVASATFQNNYLAEEVSTERVKQIKDSINAIEEGKQDVDTRLSVVNEEITLLESNRQVASDKSGLSVAELTKLLDLVEARRGGYLTLRKKLEAQIRNADERIAALNRQLNEEQQKGYQPGGQLFVKFYTKEATTTNVTITYVVPNAGWRPAYDIWAGGASGDIKLFYKANIYQNTGVKWTNVRLTLSTGNPNETAEAPNLNPWYVALYISPPPQPAALRELVVTAYKKPLVSHDTHETILTKDEINVLPTQQVNNIVSTSSGTYQSISGGTRNSGTEYIVDGIVTQGSAPAQTTINNYVGVDNSGVNTTFDIDLPYTIPSDGQQHLVAIKEFMLPASYRYYAVPKLDKDVFLQAQVTRWEDLNLLPGETRIYHEGTYIGQGMLDMRNVKDTMYISLGRDKKIIVKRDQDTKLHSKKTIGSNEHEAFGYSITMRNTRKEPINLIILDQIPVSNDKDVQIEDTETGDASVEEKTGMLTWTLQLAASETKKIDFGFSVKYPKGKTVTGLR